MNINNLKEHLLFLNLVNTYNVVKALDEKQSPDTIETILYDVIHSKELKRLDNIILSLIQEYLSSNIIDWKEQYNLVDRVTVGNHVVTFIKYIEFLIRLNKIQCDKPLSKFANAILSKQDEQTIYINYLNALNVTREQLKVDYIDLNNVSDVFNTLEQFLETNPNSVLSDMVDDLHFEYIGKMTI